MPGFVTAILLIGIGGRLTSSALSMVTYSRTGSTAPAAVETATAAANPVTTPRTSFGILIDASSLLRGGRLGPPPVVASEKDFGRLVASQHRHPVRLDLRRGGGGSGLPTPGGGAFPRPARRWAPPPPP